MKKYFKVTFEYAEGIYCTNLAHAETAEDVEREYSKYPWKSIKEAQPWDVDEAKMKGMPIIEVEPAQQPQEAAQEAPAAEAEQQPTETENAPHAATQAAEGIEITAITYTTDDDPDPAPGLLIHRPGTIRGIIIGDGVMLPDDPTDLLTAYGEREYSRDAAGNYIITDEKKEEHTMSNTQFTPAEAAMHGATAAGIIRRKGGYRERDILNHPHTIERGTWTTEHKVVEILATEADPDGYRPGCAVDIVTRAIVG